LKILEFSYADPDRGIWNLFDTESGMEKFGYATLPEKLFCEGVGGPWSDSLNIVSLPTKVPLIWIQANCLPLTLKSAKMPLTREKIYQWNANNFLSVVLP
jgi:hypothetical protein